MRRFDVNWMQTAQRALFVYICAQFGATGAFRRAATLMLIPMVRGGGTGRTERGKSTAVTG